MTDKKMFELKGSAFKVIGGCSVLFSCNTAATSNISELRGDKYMGNKGFLANAVSDLWKLLLGYISATFNHWAAFL